MSDGSVPVSIRSSRPEPPVQVTDTAASVIARARDAEGHTQPLRIAAKPGGCSGFQRVLMFDDAQREDLTFTFPVEGTADVEIIIDPDSLRVYQGGKTNPAPIVLDYVDNPLEGSGFTMQNDNISRTCGCGESFA